MVLYYSIETCSFVQSLKIDCKMESSRWKNSWMFFRRFGLDYDDLPTIMENIGNLLKLLTINIYKKAKNPIPVFFYVLLIITTSVFIHVQITSMVWMVLFRYGKAEIEKAIITFSLGMCNVTALSKLIFMKIYAKGIQNTVSHFLQCDNLVVPDTRFSKNLRRNLRHIKKRASIIWISEVTIGILYISIPFLIPGRQFTTETYIIFGLEPMLESPNYEIAMFMLILAVIFGIYTILTVAVYIIVVVGYNEAQLHTLSAELRNIWNDSQNFYNYIKHRVNDKIYAVHIKEEMENEFIRIRLKDIIRFHIACINLVHELDNAFRVIFAIDYGIITLSVIAGLLCGLENTYLSLPNAFVQIFMNCFAGQRLVDACKNFTYAVYFCKWENFNNSNQKTIYLMLVMSQKTLTLSAGGVLKLNFECLMFIVNSTYSAYTTLKSVVIKT